MTELAGPLARRLTARWRQDVEIRELRRLSGGANRETWAFEARAGGETASLVLQRALPRPDRDDSIGLEAAAIQAAARTGVPVPELVDHATEDSVIGTPYLLTRHLDGETIPRRLLREPEFAGIRAKLAAELGRVAARVHRIPPESVPGLSRPDPLERLVEEYDSLDEPLPPVEIGLHWLREHRPPAQPDTVVHGDFRNGNLIVHPDGLRAVLDWELVHLGDPMEDLGWLCVKAWRFASALPVGGFGELDDLLDGYAEVAGTRPDPATVLWWQVYGTTKWAVGCRMQAERHLIGQTRSVELAAIGRRVCEQEHDLLLALGHPAGEPVPDQGAASGLHGRPTAAELLAAVGDFLREDVLPATGGRVNFHTRVAANVLGTVQRELELGGPQEVRHAERLAALGFSSQAELAAALRSGEADPEDPEILATVRAAVTDRLAVANPRYLRNPYD
jgi:aminoglycoside phosphotransferase (APT) family kinase protein